MAILFFQGMKFQMDLNILKNILKNKIVEYIEPWTLICEFEKLLNFGY